MKKFLLTLSFLVAGIICMNAQIIKTGNITANETWTNNNIYLLNGWVYVKAGVTLTIQPGTVIKGDFVSKGALIIERDAKIIADGTADMPIVFTSQKSVGQRSYGDWGGLILCGRASVNLPANGSLGTQQGEGVIEGGVGSFYGGGTAPNDDDSSGVLRYVRIEYPGVAFQPNSEINGLTLGGVGRKTVIEHIMVSYSGDDAYEWFGGTVNCKWLIAYRTWDDDFDTDLGYRGKIQFGVVLRDPNIADQSQSNGFESDNDATGTGNTPITQPIFSNVSVFGPYCFSSSVNSLYRRALHLRRNTRTSVYNSVFAGYPTGLLIESSSTQSNATNGDLDFMNSVLAQMTDTLAATTAANPNNTNGSFSIDNFFNTPAFANTTIASASALMVSSLNLAAPDLTLQGASPLMSGASFADANVADPFFTQVAYRGAFGASDWTDCWAEWDPNSQAYNSMINNSFTVTASAGGATTFCQGGSVMIDAGGFPGATYNWSNGATTQSITVSAGGTYSVTVIKPNGCSAVSNAITVTVHPTPAAPVITPGGPTTFCNGGSVQLSSSYVSGNSWSSGPATQAINVSSSGTYIVTYTDGNGCTASDTQTVTVNANPGTPAITPGGNTSFCTGDSVQLSSSQATGNQWLLNGNPIAGATGQDYFAGATGNYSVTYTDGNGCFATSGPIQVSVSSAPAPTVNVSGSTAICPGGSVTLTSSTGTTYQWYMNGNPISGATSQSYNATAAGQYAVDVTNTDPCDGSGMSANVTVTMNTAPTAAFTYSWNGSTVVFSNGSTGATVYNWNFGDLDFSGQQDPSHNYSTNGTYTVTLIVTNAAGCTDTVTSTVSFFVGIADQAASNKATLFPNPTNGMTNIALNLIENSAVSILVYDLAGKRMVEENIDMQSGENRYSFDASQFSNGLYFVRITTAGGAQTLKLMVSNK